ncbi:NAD-specific glutamate dehydrogenase [Vibrio cholerae]|nr:NAD-specific glutamate dehydrogenase [Vibrio cholerae]
MTQRFVVHRLLTLTLQYVDGYCALVIFRRREHLVRFGWDSGVFLDEFSHHTAHGFNTQRQRRYV